MSVVARHRFYRSAAILPPSQCKSKNRADAQHARQNKCACNEAAGALLHKTANEWTEESSAVAKRIDKCDSSRCHGAGKESARHGPERAERGINSRDRDAEKYCREQDGMRWNGQKQSGGTSESGSGKKRMRLACPISASA